MSDININSIIYKRNELNELRANNFTLQELRFFSIYLAKINSNDINTRLVRFSLQDFKEIMEYPKIDIPRLKETAKNIRKKFVSIPLESGGFAEITLFDTFIVDKDKDGKWFVEIGASNTALPFMFNFKDRYFKYELWNALRLTAPSHVRIYELLKQYEKIGKREIRVDDLQEMVGTSYSRWERFKKNVLDSSQQALKETTDIAFTYERGKTGTGGKWISIIFSITRNEPTDRQMVLFEQELECHIHLETLQAISSELEPKENEEQLSETLQKMILFADDLTKNEIKEIYYAVQEKEYNDIFTSFKRLYQTARNKEPFNLKGYIMGIIRNDKPINQNSPAESAPDPDIEKYKVLINKF